LHFFIFYFFIFYFCSCKNDVNFNLRIKKKGIVKYLLRENDDDNKQIFFHIQKFEIKSDFELEILNNNKEEINKKNIIKQSTYFNINNYNAPFSLLINP
jgi:hypothetical protein